MEKNQEGSYRLRLKMQSMLTNKILTHGTRWIVTTDGSSYSSFLEDLSTVFVVYLLVFQGNIAVLVVMDRFSKTGNCGDASYSLYSLQAGESFSTMVCKQHRYPKSIMSDRLKSFKVNFGRLYLS